MKTHCTNPGLILVPTPNTCASQAPPNDSNVGGKETFPSPRLVSLRTPSLPLLSCCRWVFLHEKAYQVRDTAIESSVVTKVKGFGRYANRVMDVSDYVTPPQVWRPTLGTCACPRLGRVGTEGRAS